MSLMDIFNGFRGASSGAAPATPTPVSAATAAAATNPLVPSIATPKSDGTVGAIPAAGAGDKSPLAEYEKLWLNDPAAKPAASMAIPIPVDATKVQQQASKLDFTKAIPAELLAQITKGDSAAMLQAINLVGQSSFAASAATTAKIVEGALAQQEKIFNEQVLPAALKKHGVQSQLSDNNPIFQDPAVAPLISMVAAQFQAKFPSATTAEITQKAREYVMQTSESIVGTSKTRMVTDIPVVGKAGDGNPMTRVAEDWSAFFGEAAE